MDNGKKFRAEKGWRAHGRRNTKDKLETFLSPNDDVLGRVIGGLWLRGRELRT